MRWKTKRKPGGEGKSSRAQMRAAVALDRYLNDPPADPEEMRNLFAGLERGAVRAAALEQIRSDWRPVDAIHYEALFELIGIGRRPDPFAAIVLDETLPMGARSAALQALMAEGDAGFALLDRLSLPTVEALRREPLRTMLRVGLASSVDILPTVFTSSGEEPATIFELVEAARLAEKMPASMTYGGSLADPELGAVRRTFLDAIVREASPESLRVLREFIERFPDDRQAAEAVEAIERGERRPERSPMEEAEFVFRRPAPDVFGLLFMQELDPGVVRLVTIDVYAGMLDAAIIPAVPRADLSLDDARSAHITAPQAASLLPLFEALEPADPELVEMHERAFSFLRAIPDPQPIPLPAPSKEATARAVDAVLDGDDFEEWWIDPQWLEEEGIEIPENATAAELRDALAEIGSAGYGDVLRLSADAMAIWLVLRGDRKAAATILRAGIDAARDFANAPLPRLLVEATSAKIDEAFAEEAGETEDEFDEGSGERSARAYEAAIGVVMNQIAEERPKETLATLMRLVEAGNSRREALELIAEVVYEEMIEIATGMREYDEKRYVARLRRLPERE